MSGWTSFGTMIVASALAAGAQLPPAMEAPGAVRRLFAVLQARGPAWDPSRPMEEQQDWQAHAAFMDALEAEEFVVLGGPLEGTPDVLLVVRAADEEEVRRRLAADPWSGDLRRLALVAPWTLRLGAFPTAACP